MIASLTTRKPKFNRKTITKRNIKDILTENYNTELKISNIDINQNLSEVCKQLNEEMLETLDRVAPVKSIKISNRPRSEWLSKELYDQRRIVRNRERIWKKYREDPHWKAFQRERNRYNHMLYHSKCNIICGKIQELKRDTKLLNKYVNKLTGKTDTNPFPTNRSNQQLSEDFAEYFLTKIKTIRSALQGYPKYKAKSDESIPLFTSFSPVTESELYKQMMSMPTKSCELDTIPTEIFKQAWPKIKHIMLHIVNTSLTKGEFIMEWKTAIVRPLLKKLNAELIEKNYRPVSNLSFLSKIVERCMLKQFIDHCTNYNLIPDFQSAYREHYSTETSLLKLCNDILTDMDNKKVTMMAILDLSAAFDTVDHDIFIDVMHEEFGISGTALDWFRSYLSPRGFKVAVGDCYSSHKQLEFSVPQGSCAAAPLFTAYCAPIGNLVPTDFTINGFADDHSVRKAFNPNDRTEETHVYSTLTDSLISIKSWMHEMRLKMNGEKTEFILFGNPRQLLKCTSKDLTLESDTINITDTVKYLGGHLDKSLTMKAHINAKCKSAWFNLRKIKSIRKYITKDIANTLAVTLCLSHLDYGNSLLFGLPQTSLKILQRVQNAMAKVVLSRSKYDSSTECLKELHWLPVKQRIEYKICCVVFKCLTGRAPNYLIDLLSLKENARTLRSNSNVLVLNVPKFKTKTYGPRAFAYAGPTLWNSLPNELKEVTSIELFRKNLKTLLFRTAFNL